MDLKEREEFIMLTVLALGEEDQDKFVAYLMKRDPYISLLLKKDPTLFGDDTEECIAREVAVLERLEKERMVTIKKMDKLSEKKRAIRRYSSKFPMPSMPVFFNRTS